MTWIPVPELARAVRDAALRDQDTLAAFGVAARSRLFPELAGERGMAARADAPPEAVPADLLDPAASQLEFNARVLAVAEDERTPLLERLRYLAIVSANLDELYMGGADEVPAARAEAMLARQQRVHRALPRRSSPRAGIGSATGPSSRPTSARRCGRDSAASSSRCSRPARSR